MVYQLESRWVMAHVSLTAAVRILLRPELMDHGSSKVVSMLDRG